jgi:hypothetical protein
VAVDVASTVERAPIAVIDDRETDAELIGLLLEDAGRTPIIVSGHYDSVGALVADVKARSEYAVCDHRLRPYGMGDFDGAEVVAALVAEGFPAILITQFADDADLSIRRWRDKVPVLLRRDDASASALIAGIKRTESELLGEVPADRRPWRTLIRVEDVVEEAGTPALRVVIPGWDPNQTVTMPASMVPDDIRGTIQPGGYMFAKVNVGAVRSEDLFFKEFEPTMPDDDESF